MPLTRYFTALLLAFYALFAHAELIIKEEVDTRLTTTRDITVVQRPWLTLQAPPGKLKVTAWVDHANNRYRAGEVLLLNVKTNEDAYLYIIDVGTSGKIHVIFPNQYQKNNHVQAGRVLQVPSAKAPFQFRVGGPTGTELIKIIATKQPKPLFKPADFVRSGPFLAYKHASPRLTRDISVILKAKLKPTASLNKPKTQPDWAEYSKVIRIVR